MQSDPEPASAWQSDVAHRSRERDATAAALVAARPTIADGARYTTGGRRPDSFEATVLAGPHAPAAARAAVSDWLTGRISDDVLDDARLLLSELVTNSVRHGHLTIDATVGISARLAHDTLRFEVRDPGRDGTITPRTANPIEGGGYGLQLVATVAARWGVNRTDDTHVWFELAHVAA